MDWISCGMVDIVVILPEKILVKYRIQRRTLAQTFFLCTASVYDTAAGICGGSKIQYRNFLVRILLCKAYGSLKSTEFCDGYNAVFRWIIR